MSTTRTGRHETCRTLGDELRGRPSRPDDLTVRSDEGIGPRLATRSRCGSVSHRLAGTLQVERDVATPETSKLARDLGDPEANRFYSRVLAVLDRAAVPFLVGGAYALQRYTGISRFTKDFDIFTLPAARDRIIDLLRGAGYDTEIPFPHWLAKVRDGDVFVDIIYGSGNGVAQVDEGWFDHSAADVVLGVAVKLIPPEEMIWSKAFIMERERYDGADVAHLIRAIGDRLDWHRLVDRFGGNWRVLLAHLVLFGFIYPGERTRIPGPVMDGLVARLEAEVWTPPKDEHICKGTELSREQFLVDLEQWGYRDARLRPDGNLTPEDAEKWTAAIHSGK